MFILQTKWLRAALLVTGSLGATCCGGKHTCAPSPCPAPGTFDEASCSCASSGPPSAAAGSGGAGTTLPACSGVVPQSNQSELCRTSSDCSNGYRCAAPGSPNCAGIPASACQTDADCGARQICRADSNPCGGFECVPACSAESCASSEVCGADGRCQALTCGAGYQCPTGSQCNQGIGADPHGCNVPRCDETASCPEDEVCDPTSSTADGCAPRTCTSDADCDCGACILGQCEKELFVCVPALL